MHSSSPRILLGGVPFGRDNIGDEAILQCVVQLIREMHPGASITASTDTPDATAAKLGIRTCPLFGFDPPGYDPVEMARVLADHDAFVWAGATGLSDYPDYALAVLEEAQRQHKPTAVFCCGMNDRLNPFLYSLLPGKRRRLYETLARGSGGRLDLVARTERRLEAATRCRLATAIPGADLVIARDAESVAELRTALGKDADILTGADPALVLEPTPLAEIPLSDRARSALVSSRPKIGLCVSSQSPVRELDTLASHLDHMLERHQAELICIPMNPITDAALMQDFISRLRHRERAVVVEDCLEPEWVAGVAAQLDVVVSSRLHLLILASNSLTPIVGISRGSKVTNFTRAFGVPDVGSTDDLDGAALIEVLEEFLTRPQDFKRRARETRVRMRCQLDLACRALGQLLFGDQEGGCGAAPLPSAGVDAGRYATSGLIPATGPSPTEGPGNPAAVARLAP